LAKQKAPPWMRHNRLCKSEVLEKIARLLFSVHEKYLVHGDFMLKNIVFTPEKTDGKYWLVDLASGWSLSANKPFDQHSRNRDLFRMVYSLAGNGFATQDALFFLKAYLQNWKGADQAHLFAKKYFELSLSQKDHRAKKAARMFNIFNC